MTHDGDNTIREILAAEEAIRQRLADEDARLAAQLDDLRRRQAAESAALQDELAAASVRFLAAAEATAEAAAQTVVQQARLAAAALDALDDERLREILRRHLSRVLPAESS